MLVSVVVPVLNREKSVVETLRSVKAQTYRPLELLIVDNGSTDASISLCSAFAAEEKENEFQIILLHEEQHGASAARNCGLADAKGDYVYFFDSDDIMSRDFISHAVDVVNRSTLNSCEVDLVAAATNIRRGKGIFRRVFNYSDSVADHILTSELSTQAMFLSTDFLRRIGGWNEDLMRWNDWELGARVLLSGPKIQWLRGKSYHEILEHGESITGSNFSGSFDKLIKAFNAVEKDICELSQSPNRDLAALSFRVNILAGLLRHEGDKEHSRIASSYARQLVDSGFFKSLGSLLALYVGCGGRGAWVIARFFVRFSRSRK